MSEECPTARSANSSCSSGSAACAGAAAALWTSAARARGCWCGLLSRGGFDNSAPTSGVAALVLSCEIWELRLPFHLVQQLLSIDPHHTAGGAVGRRV